MTTETGGKHVYRPYGTALELFQYRGPEILLSGPAGTGKSRAALEKLHAMMISNPNARGVMLRKTAVSLTSTALVTFKEHVAKEALESGEVVWYGGSSQDAAQYRYANGSTISIGGLDKATRIMSSEYDVAYVQEATELSESDWEAITSRLRNGRISFQQLIADCNPDVPNHWLKLRSDRGRTKMLNSQHTDNPRIYQGSTLTEYGAAYMEKLDALTGVRKLRLRGGVWAAAEGLVYDEFDPALHIHKHIGEPPQTWRRFWSIDFGYTNPFVWQAWAVDPDGRMYLYKEIYQTKTLVEDHAKAIIKAFRGRTRESAPEAIICDHDAEGRATLERHLGRSTIAAKKDVSLGIQAVQARMRPRGDGKPGLYLCRDALEMRDQSLDDARRPTSTMDEIVGYVWDRTGNQAPKEAPVKDNDHGMDAMRYAVAHVDLGRRPQYRSFRY